MTETLFYVIGAALVLSALAITAVGLRSESFPPRAALAGGIAVVASLVIATTTLAVIQAREEQEHRNEELAEEEVHGEAGPGGGTVLDLTSPEDGTTTFEPTGLEAPAGPVTISYENPSPVQHNVALELEGKQIAISDDVTGGTVELTQKLAPGEYAFYCAIPGHRQGGMEGDLTVSGPEKP